MRSTALRDLDPALRFDLLGRLARRVARSVRSRTDVLFVGFGRRRKRGRVGHEWCLKVYVPRKLKTVPPERRVPAHYRASVVVAGKRCPVLVPTDVHELPRFRETRPMAGPVAGLCNAADPDNWGTATALVRAAGTGQTYLLSAGHVLARTAAAVPAAAGEPILDTDGDLVGTLARTSDVRTTKVDAALCTVGPVDPDALLQRADFGPVTDVCPVERVAADGTDFTLLSWVDDRYLDFYGFVVDFPAPGSATDPVTIPLVIHFGGDAEDGDSGALVVDAGGRAVGMHLWGRGGSDSYCLPIETVLTRGFAPETFQLVR